MYLFAFAVLMTGTAGAADLAAGWTHSAALEQGRVWTWGDNTYGQLGQPDAWRVHSPRPVPGLENVVAVAASWHTLALTADGTVYAWGRNTFGQLGNGHFGIGAKEPTPQRVAGLENAVAIAAGWDHSLALTRDGMVYAWGSRSHGQVGDGIRETGRPAVTPQRVAELTDVCGIAAGGFHSLALRRDGTVYAWGSNWNGQLGNGNRGANTHSAVPRPVIGPEGKGELGRVSAIAAGALHSVAVTADGRTYAWGYNGTGQIPAGIRGGFWGSSGRREVAVPTEAVVSDGNEGSSVGAMAAAAGYESTYVLTSEGKVLASGWSIYGEQGSGSTGGNADKLTPVVMGRKVVWTPPAKGLWRPSLLYRYTDEAHAAEGITDFAATDSFSGPGILVGDTPATAVRNGYIRRNAQYIEVQAALAYPAQAVVATPVSCLFSRLMFGAHQGDNDYATAVRLRWTHAETGENIDIALGTDEPAGASILPALSEIASLASGLHHVLARDRSGAIWAWGHNGFGQIGDGSVLDCTVARKLAPFAEGVQPQPPRPAVMESTAPDVPPVGKVTNVREHGVTGDGITLEQTALQILIDDCGAAGGGIVWFPPGTYRTGTLFLRNGVRLHLSAGATILASTNREHYPDSALIKALDVQDIGITGRGTIDAQGHFVGARDWRHNCINMENCRNILVEGIRTVNSGAWTEHYIRCIGLTIRDVTVRSLRPGRNNDGIDLSGCEDVRIEGCTVIADDDAIVIKSQRAERVNRNIEVINDICHTYRGAFKLGTETRSTYENIICRNMTSYGAKAIELYSVDGSETSGIVVEDIHAHEALVALNIRLGARLRRSYWAKELEPKVGYLRDIRIKNVEVDIGNRSWREILLDHDIPGAEWATAMPETPYDSCISGLPEHPVENVVIENLRVRVPGGMNTIPDAATLPERPEIYPHAGNFGVLPAHGLFVRHANGVTVRNAVFELSQPDARPPVAEFDTHDLVVE